ncbi:MAG: hypothetical protein NZT61_02175 [Deltaproteobacteria bacterium]|nr:hypothetical protein [Deltaproteobacteria bacterium]
MSKKIFKKGKLVDLLLHVPHCGDVFASIPDKELPSIFSKLVKSKRLHAVGLVRGDNTSLWLEAIARLEELDILVIPVVQVNLDILNCKKFTFSCFLPPDEPEQSTTEFIRRFEALTSLNFSSKMQALVDLVELSSGFILPTKVDLTPASLQCVPVLHADWGFNTFDIVYQETKEHLKRLLGGKKYQIVACSDAVLLSQIASRTISVSEGSITFASLRALVKGKNSRLKYSINLQPTGVFREKFHANL